MGSGTIRIGGLCGLGAAGVIIPAYLVGSPERPSDPSDAHTYFDSAASFVTANGTWPLLHILFTVLFLAILVSMLRSAAGPTGAVHGIDRWRNVRCAHRRRARRRSGEL